MKCVFPLRDLLLVKYAELLHPPVKRSAIPRVVARTVNTNSRTLAVALHEHDSLSYRWVCWMAGKSEYPDCKLRIRGALALVRFDLATLDARYRLNFGLVGFKLLRCDPLRREPLGGRLRRLGQADCRCRQQQGQGKGSAFHSDT